MNKPLKVTRDSGANVKLLKKLKKQGLIELHAVMLENGRENKKVPEKILPIAIFDHARWGEAVFSDENTQYDAIREVVGLVNVEDAMHLEAHLRSGNDYFVTEDRGDILSKKEELLKQFGINVVSPDELEEIVTQLT